MQLFCTTPDVENYWHSTPRCRQVVVVFLHLFFLLNLFRKMSESERKEGDDGHTICNPPLPPEKKDCIILASTEIDHTICSAHGRHC